MGRYRVSKFQQAEVTQTQLRGSARDSCTRPSEVGSRYQHVNSKKNNMETQCPSSLFTAYLSQPPSCLQFLPSDPEYLVIGTYLLSEDKEGDAVIAQKKTGSLQLWYLDIKQKTL